MFQDAFTYPGGVGKKVPRKETKVLRPKKPEVQKKTDLNAVFVIFYFSITGERQSVRPE